jgi:hypothetical protein
LHEVPADVSRDRVTEVDLLQAVTADLRSGVRTASAGIVVSYDPAQRTAKVQPARRSRARDGTTFTPPIVPACKVMWERRAGIVRVGRLNPGDKVLLVAADRELDGFLLTGALYEPTSKRKHRLTDAVCFPVDFQTTRPITVGDGGNSDYWGREDGTAGISIPIDVPAQIEVEGGPAGIRLGSQAVDFALLGTTVAAAFTTFTVAVAAQAISTPVGTAVQNAAFLTGLIAHIATLGADIVNWQATKVLVE